MGKLASFPAGHSPVNRPQMNVPSRRKGGFLLLTAMLVIAACNIRCQGQNAQSMSASGIVPTGTMAGGYIDSAFTHMDLMELQIADQKHGAGVRGYRAKMLADGALSPLDLEAPHHAIEEFNKGTACLHEHKTSQAIGHLEKAIADYPNFVSAHNHLGLAYWEADDEEHARQEFESASRLDGRFAEPFFNLGKLALSQKDFTLARPSLEHAAAVRPHDVNILMALVYAQNGTHEYRHAIDTTEQVHALPHSGMATVHYIAAASAIALKDFDVVQRELELLLKEDPSNPLAPTATYDLQILAASRTAQPSVDQKPAGAKTAEASATVHTFPNSESLRLALASLDGDDEPCSDCLQTENATDSTSSSTAGTSAALLGTSESSVWKIRGIVDEVAVLFSVTDRGKLIDDLTAEQFKITDDGKPPSRILQFTRQSDLPLRLGLLIDTSGSVKSRFSFEKKAAIRFLQQVLTNSADRAFVAGFSGKIEVMQDFTANKQELAAGIDELKTGGGTSIWDAVSFACWKLAMLPEKERVSRVLVLLSDGEDNMSRISLRRAIQDAEATGVTIYSVSTKEFATLPLDERATDADKVLQALSERTGGEAVVPGNLEGLNPALLRLREVIRSRYLVAYKPAEFVDDGRFRKITISVSRNGRRLKVHAREGYHARRPEPSQRVEIGQPGAAGRVPRPSAPRETE